MKHSVRIYKYIVSLVPVLVLFLILLRPTIAFRGASSGLLLWFNTLLPTLLPSMILADLIRRLRIVDIFCNKLTSHFGVPLYFLYPLLLGLICGLPLGAKLVAESVKSGQLSKKSGQFLLTICNNCSMMFLIGYVAEQQLHEPGYAYKLAILIPLASLLSAGLCKLLFFNRISYDSYEVSTNSAFVSPRRDSFLVCLQNSILDSFTVITQVGGFVILFSLLAEYLLPLSSSSAVPFVSSLEVCCGIHTISQRVSSRLTRIRMAFACASFTGFSGIAQTACVLHQSGLSVFYYFISRVFSAIIIVLLLYFI